MARMDDQMLRALDKSLGRYLIARSHGRPATGEFLAELRQAGYRITPIERGKADDWLDPSEITKAATRVPTEAPAVKRGRPAKAAASSTRPAFSG